ncbi:Glycine/D-amino acid oxidase [Dyella jiangningensis]|uniref:FAD-dependent oxidoreductase n=1 Tax=Dyella sp. AtDHG13 TaxID=1938897 RepID=UPI00088AC64A|nr:FAD-dependent oxidoreductase [Dyella sp. AtDHG13]PXV59181.1 glycine/D-amino acid oxidase-like deaminating enzyme [Dyella sp. AtDHG13]SDK25077.1 Glycine/D-amino acid oxidase [Dyella jiangningensis]
MERRQFLRQAGTTLAVASTAGIAACAGPRVDSRPASTGGTFSLPLIRATTDRITGVYVCTRPYRAEGPRIETQKLGKKTVVHNYGHGGSGWSLSWGSGTLALQMVQATGAKELGVIGCGAIGLTTALLAQRAGLSVRIYAKALPPDVFSMRASGLWTPDSRICDAAHAPALADRWEMMARMSYARYQSLLGLPGKPIEWIDGYSLSDAPFGKFHGDVPDEPQYGEFEDRVRDLTPRPVELAPGTHPFPEPYVRRYTTLMFNISSYADYLMNEYRAAGGKIEIREFEHPEQLQQLPEHTLVNATGYGARALFGDTSVIPVRGQTARLIPQPEVTYGLRAQDISVVPRSDGIMVQVIGDSGNFNNADITPHREASEAAVRELADIMAKMKRT